MRRFSVKGRYEPLMAGQVISARGRFRARFMTEELTHVTIHEHADDEGVLVGVGDGQFEVQVDGFPFLYVQATSTGKVWFQTSVANQSVIIDEPSIFTSLDRPPPVSPEIRYMQQLMMANTRMREEMMNEHREIMAARTQGSDKAGGTRPKGDARRSSAIETVSDGEGSEAEASRSEIPGGSETPDEPAVEGQ